MPFDTSDALTEESVRNRLEEIVQERLGFRAAFREVGVPDDVGETWKIPQPDDTIGEPTTIEPGAEYPATEEDYSKVEINREKHGFKMEFLDEAIMDNVSFDVVADQVDRAGRQFREYLNSQAYTVLSNNLNSDSPTNSGSSDSTLSRDDYLAGMSTLEGFGYDPDLMIVEENGLSDLRTDADFTRSTQMGDDVVRTGDLPSVDGMEITIDTTNQLGDSDAIIVDTDYYGYEAVWEGVTTESERDFDTDKEKRKARTYRQWKDMDASAAIKIDG